MKSINKIQIPTTTAEDCNKDKSTWKNGKYIALDEGSHVTYYIGHESERVEQLIEDSETITEAIVTTAFPVRVKKPVTRDAAINAAEMEAYNLQSAMDVASFTAALARKSRENAQDEEVAEHDEFIAWVKSELTQIGV